MTPPKLNSKVACCVVGGVLLFKATRHQSELDKVERFQQLRRQQRDLKHRCVTDKRSQRAAPRHRDTAFKDAL